VDERAQNSGSIADVESQPAIVLDPSDFQLFFECLPGPYVVLYPDFRVVAANDSYLKLTGYSRNEVVGKNLFEAFSSTTDEVNPEASTQIRASLERVLESRCSDRLVVQTRAENTGASLGSHRRVWSLCSSPIIGADEVLRFILHQVEDITEQTSLAASRLAAEVALQASEHRYRDLTEVAAQSIWVAGPDGSVNYCNQYWRDYTGLDVEHTTGDGWLSVIHPEHQKPARRAWLEALLDGRSWKQELLICRVRDSTYRWHLVQGLPVHDTKGNVLHWTVIAVDIDDRIQAEQARQRLASVVENSLDFIAICNDDGIPFYINQAGLEMVGAAGSEDYKSNPLSSFFLSTDKDFIESVVLPTVHARGAWRGEMNLRHFRTGRAIPANHEIFRIDNASTPRSSSIAVLSRDMTDRRRMESEIRRSEQRYRLLIDSIPQMVWTATPEGQFNYVNGKVAAYSGVSGEAFLGSGWLAMVHPDDRDSAAVLWGQALSSLEAYEAEFRLLRASDQQWRWQLVRAVPLFDPRGEITLWFGTCTDIETQKHAEIVLARANEELEQFAYAAAHDLQEPLRALTSYTQLLSRRLEAKLGDEDRHFMGFIIEGSRRMGELIHDLREYLEVKGGGTAEQTAVALEEVKAAVLIELEPAIQESGAAITSDPLPIVMSNRDHLVQVFQNLLSNAIKYRSPQRQLQVHISAALHGSTWQIGVEDNGVGIGAAYREQVFGLFKRLHGRDTPGTGIGLAICQKIIERSGGRIWVENNHQGGSSFFFTLTAASTPLKV
jgi:PAS domain S-box-containing protein